MDKRQFICAYVISAIAGAAIGRGSLKPEELVQDALDTWNVIEAAMPSTPTKKVKE